MKALSFLFLFGFSGLIVQYLAPMSFQSGGTGSSANLTEIPAICSNNPCGCDEFLPGQSIKIGLGAPMTGNNSEKGVEISRGEQIAIVDGGNIQSWSFELSIQDDFGTQEGGAAAATALASDPAVVAVAGHAFSSSSISALPIYENACIPMMSPTASLSSLTQMGSKIFNRVIFTSLAEGQFAAHFLYLNLGIRELAVINDGSDYGLALATGITNRFIFLGGNVVATLQITPGQTDYSGPLSLIAPKHPQAIYFGGYVGDAVIIFNQMGQTGLGNAIFIGGDAVLYKEFITRTNLHGEGAYAVSMIPPMSPEQAQFDTEYRTRFGVDPSVILPYSWYSYDAVSALISVIKKIAVIDGNGNLYIPRGELIKEVRNLKNYKGLIGTLTCDFSGECNNSGPNFSVVQGANWVPVGFANDAYFSFLPRLFQ